MSSCFATRVVIGPAGTVLWPHPCLMRIQLIPCHLPAIRRELFYSSARSLLFSAAPDWLTSFYNLAWATIAVLLLYRCFSLTVTNATQRACAAVLLGAVLPTGMVAFDPDRPEMPAFCVLVAILLLWRHTSSVVARSSLLGCTGLLILIHPFAGIAGWLLVAFLLAFGEGPPRPAKGRLQVMLAGSGVYALILVIWVLSMWWQDHTALHRFLQHAAGQGTGAGMLSCMARRPALRAPVPGCKMDMQLLFASSLIRLFRPRQPWPPGLLFSSILVAVYAFREPERRYLLLQCFLLLLVLLIFPFAVFPAQTNYLGISRALLLAVLFIGGFPLATALRGTIAPLCLILVAFAVTAPWAGLEMLQNAEARASYRNALNQAARVHLYFEQRGVHNPALLVDWGHYFLYKPYFSDLYNPNYLEPGDSIDQYQGLVLCYSGSRAFSRAQLPPSHRARSERVEPDRRWRGYCARHPLCPPDHAPQLDLDVRRVRAKITAGRANWCGPLAR